MAQVVNQIRTNGPIEQVFDIVTTARYWPRWPPATMTVGGVTERPRALGDVVHERAQLGVRVYKGDWTVAEHVRRAHVVPRIAGRPTQITYTFEAAEAARQITIFRRELVYQPEGCLSSAAIQRHWNA